jgi:ribosomal protein S27E
MAMQIEFPKCPVCGSTAGYESSGVVGKYAKCFGCMTKWKMLTENQKTSALILHELPKNGVALYKVPSTKTPLFTVMGQPLGLDFWKNLNLEGKIDWESLSKRIDGNISNCVIKENMEVLLHSWTGNRIVRNVKAIPGSFAAAAVVHQLGALLLTSRRLIWLERRQTGVWKPVISFQVAHETLLENIKGITAESGDSSTWKLPKKVSIVDNTGEEIFNLQYAFLELLKPMIENAVKMRRNEIEAEKKKDKVHVMLDFSFLKTIMEKGGLVMQVLKCPECGATVDFPKSGNETTCSHCGKTIHAQDVFEKIKDLI